MLVIRFATVGRKNHKQYRIVVQEKTKTPTGRHTAVVGSYDPHSKETVLKADEIKHWIANGAQPSDSVYNLLVRQGVIEGEKRKVKVPEKKEEEVKEKEESTGAEPATEEKTEETPTEEAKADPEEAPEAKEKKAE